MDSRAIIEVIDNLESTSATSALSANQGRVLKGLIDGISSDSDLPLKIGTSDEPVAFNQLSTGLYRVTGVYKYCSSYTDTTTTNEHLFVSIKNDSTIVYITIISPTAVIKRVIITNNVITTNNNIQIKEDAIYFNNKLIQIAESAWTDLVLENNVQAYSTAQKPQYKKIGNQLFIRGVVKNVTTLPTTIGTLPEGYRPSRRLILSGMGINTTPIRVEIETTGEIKIDHSTFVSASTYWYSISNTIALD